MLPVEIYFGVLIFNNDIFKRKKKEIRSTCVIEFNDISQFLKSKSKLKINIKLIIRNELNPFVFDDEWCKSSRNVRYV